VQVSNFDIHALAHAGASYATTPVADIYDGSALLYFTPTQSPGAYAIEFRSGATRLVIPVVQVP
jgi:ABC-type branched-subunit amino acid transport system substrate-binding protein